MHSLNMLKELAAHMNWAEGRIWETVLSITSASEDKKLKELLHHNQLTKNAFYNFWTGQPMEFPELSEFETLRDMAKWASQYLKLVQNHIDGMDKKDIDKIVIIPWADRIEKILGKKPADSNMSETILQLTMHSAHHRGQINSCIRELKAEPPLVDFIAWVWLGKPEAVWPV
jgi:uncharacterized damage-inducible protein DinB